MSELFDLKKVRVSSHFYNRTLLRKGWDEKTTNEMLLRLEFKRVGIFDDLVVKNQLLKTKMLNNPKCMYYLNERENMILSVERDNQNKGGKCLTTCLEFIPFLHLRYPQYHLSVR
jgi:hypothetical protein